MGTFFYRIDGVGFGTTENGRIQARLQRKTLISPREMTFTIWLFDIAMENGTFIDGYLGLPINSMVIFHGGVTNIQSVLGFMAASL